jgi:hypothetical protein
MFHCQSSLSISLRRYSLEQSDAGSVVIAMPHEARAAMPARPSQVSTGIFNHFSAQT